MNDCASLLPTYASDTSGVASALYELGGMTVIHDASGCNSTYSTFDEPRWYDQESLVVISALTESDAVLGNEQKLIDDCLEQARLLKPKFLSLANSPLAMLMGCDMEAIANQIERELGIPCFAIASNGIHSYVAGASQAFVAIANRFARPCQRSEEKSLNLLGLTPLDIGKNELSELLRWSKSFGFRRNACVAQHCDLSHIERLGAAHVNLVLSSTGLPLAKALAERFGTPYVTGRPYGLFAEQLAEALWQAADSGQSSTKTLARGQKPQSLRVALVGESVTMASMARALAPYGYGQSRIFCPLEGWEAILGEKDLGGVENEDTLADFLKDCDLIVGDPLYRLVAPVSCPFLPLPHAAFSGRAYLSVEHSLIQQGLEDVLVREGIC
ncbi:MAG: nitrogenase component 1 [Desulfovibrio sp.]|nr:nitrogenase component 1 [Desulfovibrio sp.]